MILSTLLLCGLLAPRAAEVQIPRNDGWVTDLAGLLTANEERSLESLMESYKQGSSHEIALLTIPSLEGEGIERFALEVGRGWGIGGAEENNGALLLIAKEDRKMRIEVGRGLEGGLTDSISGRIIRDVISPAFKQGKFYAGIHGGISAMHAAIGGDYGPIQNTRESRRDSGGMIAAGGMMFFFVIISLLSRLGRRGRRRGGNDSLWWMLLLGSMMQGGGRGSHGLGGRGGGSRGGGGGFSGFGGGGGFSGGGASGGW